MQLGGEYKIKTSGSSTVALAVVWGALVIRSCYGEQEVEHEGRNMRSGT